MRKALIAAGAIAGGMLAWQASRKADKKTPEKRARRRGALAGQVAVVTGGSRGLGLQLARDLGALGCRLSICARDEAELERGRMDLEKRDIEVMTAVCDVTSAEQMQTFVERTVSRFGSLDIVVANAGMIQVGPLENMHPSDFEEAMNVMFWGVFHTVWPSLPYMRRAGRGKIVTITSIGGKVPVPHLVPYSCAKAAAVAFSEGLRAECAPQGIDVVTIVPGLLRTGSHVNAQFKGQADREYAWFSLGAATPGLSMSYERASRQIIDAMRKGRSHKVLTAAAQIASRIHGAFPEFSAMVAELANRLVLPESGDSERVSGREAERQLNSRLHRAITMLGRRAGHKLNELPT